MIDRKPGQPRDQRRERVDIDRLRTAKSTQDRSAAQLGEHRVRLGLGDRRQAHRGIVEDFDENAAQTGHHERPEARVANDAREKFDPARRHRLYRDALESGARHPLGEIAPNPLEGALHFRLRDEIQLDAAGVAFVLDIRREDFQHHRKAALRREPRRLAGGPGRASDRGGNSGGLEYLLRFDLGERVTPGRSRISDRLSDICVFDTCVVHVQAYTKDRGASDTRERHTRSRRDAWVRAGDSRT